ncbi:MAG: hypothetical protein AAGH60_04110 [Pseudomonadota bacterium]
MEKAPRKSADISRLPSRANEGARGYPATSANAGSRSAELGAELLQAIEGEVIPRLLLAHKHMSVDLRADLDGMRFAAGDEAETAGTFDAPTVREFSRLLIDHPAQVATGFADMYVAQGLNAPDVLMDLCAPAARELGDMWLRDECSFCDVTIGVSTLEQVMMRLVDPVAHLMPTLKDGLSGKSAFLALLPGSQHFFGLLVAKEMFGQGGWNVHTPQSGTIPSLLSAVRSRHFDVAGLSVGSVEALSACRSLMKSMRAESLNQNVILVVGGTGVLDPVIDPASVGADLIVRDVREGLADLDRLMQAVATQREIEVSP